MGRRKEKNPKVDIQQQKQVTMVMSSWCRGISLQVLTTRSIKPYREAAKKKTDDDEDVKLEQRNIEPDDDDQKHQAPKPTESLVILFIINPVM